MKPTLLSAIVVTTAGLLGITAPHAGAGPGECDPAKTIGRFAHAFIHDDHAEIGALTTNDVAWSIPGHSRVSGEHRGQSGVIELADLLAQYGVRITLRAYTFGTDTIAVEIHDSGQQNGRSLDQDVVNVVSISEDCKVSRVEQHVADVSGFDTYFA
jgi:uncharacterized protein